MRLVGEILTLSPASSIEACRQPCVAIGLAGNKLGAASHSLQIYRRLRTGAIHFFQFADCENQKLAPPGEQRPCIKLASASGFLLL